MLDPDKQEQVTKQSAYFSPCSLRRVSFSFSFFFLHTWANPRKTAPPAPPSAAASGSIAKDRPRQTKALTNRQPRPRRKRAGGQGLNNALACFSIFSHHDFSSGLSPEISASNWKLDNSIRRQLLPSWLYMQVDLRHEKIIKRYERRDAGTHRRGCERKGENTPLLVTVTGGAMMCLFAPPRFPQNDARDQSSVSFFLYFFSPLI